MSDDLGHIEPRGCPIPGCCSAAEEIARLRALLEAVLLFYGAEWTPAEVARWESITGSPEASTRVLCDAIRAVLASSDKEDRA